MKSYESKTYECRGNLKCGSVTMDLVYLEAKNSRSGVRELVHRSFHSIKSYGNCVLSKEFDGVIPEDRIKDCPFISLIHGNKNPI